MIYKVMGKKIRAFVDGFLSIFNLIEGEHIFVEYSQKSPYEIDYNAILSDWNAVGNDIRNSFYMVATVDLKSNELKEKNLDKLLDQLIKKLHEQKEEKEKFQRTPRIKPGYKPAIPS